MGTIEQLIDEYNRKQADYQTQLKMLESVTIMDKEYIGSLISLSWQIRYSNTHTSVNLAEQALKIANEHNDPLTGLYSRLMRAVCMFIRNENSELLLGEFFDLANEFSEYSSEWGYYVSKIQLAGVYELLGEYTNGSEALRGLDYELQVRGLRDIESEYLIVSGNLFYRKNEIEKAIKQYNKALTYNDELNDAIRYAAILNLLGRACNYKKDTDVALRYYENAFMIQDAINDSGIVNTYIGLASYYKRKNDAVKITEYYDKAFSSLLKKDKYNRITCFYGRGHYYFEIKEYDLAGKDFEEALSIAKSNNIRNKLGDIYKSLSAVYEKTGKLDKALKCYKEFFEQKAKFEKDIFKYREDYDILHSRNNHLLKDISAASRIQNALLPSQKFIDSLFADHLLFFKPASIVSGDFFWITVKNEQVIVILADCTGHGVQASLISIMGISFLDEIIRLMRNISPKKILNKLKDKIVAGLNKFMEETPRKEGMDMAVCILDKKAMTLKLQHAGANRPILVFRNGELRESEFDNMPVGYTEEKRKFNDFEQEFFKDDVVYLFSDGYHSQIGGPKSRPFQTKQLKSVLSEIHQKPFDEQKLILESKLNEWAKFPDPNTGLPHEQTDDISIFAFRI